MIYIVLGFHKSGTTLVARTLHEAGINMGVTETGEYPKCKYEDKRVQKIKNDILYDGQITPSYAMPTSYNDCSADIEKYIQSRRDEGNIKWGFKCPDVTLCYKQFELLIPFWSRAVGVRRNLADVLAHYNRHSEPPEPHLIEAAYHVYNTMLRGYKIPIINYEDIMDCGPIVIENATGLKNLPDVRRKKQ